MIVNLHANVVSKLSPPHAKSLLNDVVLHHLDTKSVNSRLTDMGATRNIINYALASYIHLELQLLTSPMHDEDLEG